ncbi:hypothetical protein YC2023_014496 [Brassica napus]
MGLRIYSTTLYICSFYLSYIDFVYVNIHMCLSRFGAIKTLCHQFGSIDLDPKLVVFERPGREEEHGRCYL